MSHLAALALAALATLAARPSQDDDPDAGRFLPTLVTSFGGSQSEAVTAAACNGDALWIAGRTHSEDGPLPAQDQADRVTGFVVRIDAVTGEIQLAVPIEAGVPRDVTPGVDGSITVCGGTDDHHAFFVRLSQGRRGAAA